MPMTYVANDDRQLTLALVDSASGRIIKQLTQQESGGGSGAPTIPKDRSILYYGQGAGTCGAVLLKMSPAGGTSSNVFTNPPTNEAPHSEADYTPSVRPDGRLLAFGRNECFDGPPAHDIQQVAILDTATGRQVSAYAGIDGPASTQAWSSDGNSLLAIKFIGTAYNQPIQNGLHLLSVDDTGRVTADRLLPSPQAGCYYQRALFSPATSDIIAELGCQGTTSLLELDPATGKVLSTLIPAKEGQFVKLGPLDASGRYLAYGIGAPAQYPVLQWFVLTDGRSTKLSTVPGVNPAAW